MESHKHNRTAVQSVSEWLEDVTQGHSLIVPKTHSTKTKYDTLSRDCLCAESSPACLSPNAMYEQHTYHNEKGKDIHIYCLHVFFISSHRGLSHNHKGCTKVRINSTQRGPHHQRRTPAPPPQVPSS